MIDSILCHNNGLSGIYRILIALAGKVRDTRSTIVTVDKIILRCKLDGFARLNGIDTQSQSVKILHFVRRIVDSDILVVIVHLVQVLHPPLLNITIPIMPDIEHLLDNQVV